MGNSYLINVTILGCATFLVKLCLICKVNPEAVKRIEINGYAQGTTYHIIYYAPDSNVVQKQADSILSGLDKSVSLYLPTSLISRFNHSVKGIAVDRQFCILIRKAIEINRATQGAVDVTVKPLVDAWGFGVNKPAKTPGHKQIKEILKYVGTNKIWLQGNFLHKRSKHVQIDLNGIAQGYSADLLAELLEHYGITNYMVEIGGELRIKSSKPDKEPFRIGIEAIDGNDIMPSPIRKVIAPGYGAITTSGNYRKHLEVKGKQISHIMNAKTGYPAENEMISVTVWAKDGITADGYDNGFMVMGLKNTLRFLKDRTDMGAYIIYKKSSGLVADTVTKGFKGYDVH
jgi:thiamine biosynthesis lipoprotein